MLEGTILEILSKFVLNTFVLSQFEKELNVFCAAAGFTLVIFIKQVSH